MKSFLVSFLLFLLVLQGSMRTLLVVSFEYNRAYIETNLCENRNAPEMNCKGKCYLSKKMMAHENQERKQHAIAKVLDDMALDTNLVNLSLVEVFHTFRITPTTFYFFGKGELHPLDFFHPPQHS